MKDVRLIDANSLLEKLEEWHKPDEREYNSREAYIFDIRSSMYNEIISAIQKEATFDCEPRAHGYWRRHVMSDRIVCSNCLIFNTVNPRWRYCPYCGAKMDERIIEEKY